MVALFLEAVLLIVLTVLAALFGGGTLWFLWLLATADFALLVYSLFFKLRKRNKEEISDKNPVLHIDETFEMSGSQFENYVAGLYERLGYKIISVKKSRDQGIDIIVRRVFKIGLQVKCYDRPVGVRAVQEAAAGKKFYGLKKAAVVTNSIFTASAKQLADKNRIRLIDRKALAKMAKQAGER